MKSQYFDSMENARSFLETIGDALPKDFKSLPPSPLPSSPTPCSPFVSTMMPSPVSLAFSSASSSSYRPLSPTSDSEQKFIHDGVFQFERSKGGQFLYLTPLIFMRTWIEFLMDCLNKSYSGDGEGDDVIRCVCGLYLDEGVMIQCESCQVRFSRQAPVFDIACR